MKQPFGALAAAGTLLCLAGACAKVSRATGPSGQVHISTATQVSQAARENTDGSTRAICATFTLVPYAVNTDSSISQAGTPVSYSTSSTSNATDQILGCIASTNQHTFQNPNGSGSVQANWAYFVSATSFDYCDGLNTTASPALDQTTVDPAPAFFAPVNCVASTDEDLAINYPVSITAPNAGGYIDVSAGVDATTQYTGCKNAEVVSGTLYFGESNTIDENTNAPLGLIGIDTSAGDAFLSQYGGQVSAQDPNDNTATMTDTSYTGQFAALSGSPTLPGAIFQTFLTNAAQTALFTSGAASCTEWVDTRHAICSTTVSGTDSSTVASLADAFLFVPGAGYAAASVVNDPTDTSHPSEINLLSQLAANSGSDYTSDLGFAATANALPGFASSSPGDISSSAGFNDGLKTQSVYPPTVTPSMTFTGVYIDPAHLSQFVVTLTDGAASYWAALSDSTGTWVVGPTADISSAPAGVVGAQPVGCLNISACNPAASPFGGGSGTSTDPYLVCTAAQLNNVSSDLTASYLQTADIDLSSICGPTLGSGSTSVSWAPIGQWTSGVYPTVLPTYVPFSGTYDGGGHAISNLYLYSLLPAQSGKDDTMFEGYGLFGISSGAIKNVNVVDAIVNEGNRPNVGALVGALVGSGSVTSSNAVGGSINGYVYVGGLIGRAQENAQIDLSSASATVLEDSSYGTDGDGTGWGVAGLVGGVANKGYSAPGTQISLVSNVHITRSYATGNVTALGDGAGGLIGYFTSGTVAANSVLSGSFATGAVSCTGAAYGCGGLIGEESSNTVEDCYSTGSVTGVSYMAGSIGHLGSAASVLRVYTAAAVVSGGPAPGPFVSLNQGSGTLADLFYWNGASPALSNSQGIGAGLTAAAMANQGSYTGFDFTTPVWKMPTANPFSATNGILAPVLAWQCGRNGVVCP